MYWFPPRESAQLVKRYKRFLADVITPAGKLLTIHCANTGAMTGCATPGDTMWYSTSRGCRHELKSSLVCCFLNKNNREKVELHHKFD